LAQGVGGGGRKKRGGVKSCQSARFHTVKRRKKRKKKETGGVPGRILGKKRMGVLSVGHLLSGGGSQKGSLRVPFQAARARPRRSLKKRKKEGHESH